VKAFGDKDAVWWYPISHEGIARELLFRPSLMQPSILVETRILRDNPYQEGIFFDDYELWTRLVPRFVFGNIPEVLTHYRCHDRQTHILQSKKVIAEFQRYRFRYFYTMYPDASLGEYLALARVSDRVPMTSLTELVRAGEWLNELSRGQDLLLRQRMMERWDQTCEFSALLGSEVEGVRREYKERCNYEATGLTHEATAEN